MAPAAGARKGLLDNYDDAEGYYNFQVGPPRSGAGGRGAGRVFGAVPGWEDPSDSVCNAQATAQQARAFAGWRSRPAQLPAGLAQVLSTVPAQSLCIAVLMDAALRPPSAPRRWAR